MEPLARFARKDGGCGRVNRRVMCAGRARVPVKAAAQKRRRLRTADEVREGTICAAATPSAGPKTMRDIFRGARWFHPAPFFPRTSSPFLALCLLMLSFAFPNCHSLSCEKARFG